MRKNEEDAVRAAMEWKPTGKRTRRRSRKKWMNKVEIHKKIGVQKRKTPVVLIEKWREIAMAANTFKKY